MLSFGIIDRSRFPNFSKNDDGADDVRRTLFSVIMHRGGGGGGGVYRKPFNTCAAAVG